MHTAITTLETAIKLSILRAAVKLARTKGFRKFSRLQVAREAGVATGTVSYHYGAMSELRNVVMKYAIMHECLEIIAQGLAERHVLVLKIPEDLKRKAARHLI